MFQGLLAVQKRREKDKQRVWFLESQQFTANLTQFPTALSNFIPQVLIEHMCAYHTYTHTHQFFYHKDQRK